MGENKEKVACATANTPQAQYNPGCSLTDGIGTAKDPSAAARWFYQAAQKGRACWLVVCARNTRRPGLTVVSDVRDLT